MAATAQSVSRSDTLFGPPSEPINIQQFITDAYNALNTTELQDEYDTLSEESKLELLQECSLADLCDSVNEISGNPKLMIVVQKDSERTLQGLVDEDVPNTKKRKRDTSKAVEAIDHLREVMKSEIGLECWPLKQDANMFIRSPKFTELNSLNHIKFAPYTPDAPPIVSPETRHAILSVSFHNRPWRGRGPVSEFSQHVFYSGQTLEDLYNALLCPSKEIPDEEYDEDGRIIGYVKRDAPSTLGAIIIDEVVYSTGNGDTDYANHIMEHNNSTKKPAQLSKATKTMQETLLSSLTLRTQHPYWLLHSGNCEHFFVVESIRLQHPRDFPNGYPLTTKVIPIQLDTCRACKTPAAVSVVNDIRLGESPCLLCLPCWEKMGKPDEDEGVVVIPLPEYKAGW